MKLRYFGVSSFVLPSLTRRVGIALKNAKFLGNRFAKSCVEVTRANASFKMLVAIAEKDEEIFISREREGRTKRIDWSERCIPTT
jgi:hypothetical protein